MKVYVDEIIVRDMDLMETIVKALEKDDEYEVSLREMDGFDMDRNRPTRNGKYEYHLCISKKVDLIKADADSTVGFCAK